MTAVTVTFGVAGSPSLTTSVTVWPASMPVVVPLIGAARYNTAVIYGTNNTAYYED